MARFNFGAGENDFVFVALAAPSLGTGVVVPSLAVRTVTFYSAATGGTQYTDLLVGGSAATSVTTDANGFIPAFQGPVTGQLFMWADANAGGGPRRLIVTTDISAGTVTSVAGKTGAVTLVPADAGADASGAATSATATHVSNPDPHGDRAWINANFRAVIEYDTTTSTWPTRISSATDQSKRKEWVDGSGIASTPTGAGYMAIGDILHVLPA